MTYHATIYDIKKCLLFSFPLLLAGLGLTPSLFAQTTVAYWAQNSNSLEGGGFGFAPASFPQDADEGTGTLTIGNFLTDVAATGAYSYIQSFGGTTDNAIGDYTAGGSFSPQGGAGNGNNGMYFDLNLNLTGFTGIKVSWAQRGTGSGFTSREVHYSTDGGETFTSYATDEGALGSSWEVKSFDLSSVTALNENPNAVIRVVLDGATGETGNNRFDNILVQSTSGSGGGGDSQITIRDLNTYPQPLTTASAEEMGAHPLVGKEVSFTALVVSNPSSSGLASYSNNTIGRVHVFVTDTTALNDEEGRSGMSLQIVESNLDYVESLVRGGIYTFTGQLTFFNTAAQFDLTAQPVEVGNVLVDYPEYAELLEPWVITLDELNINNGDGTYELNVENYSKYIGQYVKIEGASVIVYNLGARPNWGIDSGSRTLIYDTSLRYRNDKTDNYKAGYNYRRSVANGGKGDFVPPSTGSLVNVSGFLTLNGFDPADVIADGREIFKINPFEDGTYWSNDGVRFDDGQDLGGGFTFEWPNDVEVVGYPPQITEVTLSPDKKIFAATDDIVLTADITLEEGTLDTVQVLYSINGGETVFATMTPSEGAQYSFTFPSFSNGDIVAYSIRAVSSTGLSGTYPVVGSESFLVFNDGISAISLIQKTGDGKSGASPLAGLTDIPMDITGTIVSDSEDGVIILHDDLEPWSGIFLERTTQTINLKKGDQIRITQASVEEAAVTSTNITLTVLTDLTFTTVSTGNDVDAAIPSVLSDDLVATLDAAEFEPYEGMLLRFEDAKFLSEGGFGEFEIANKEAGAADYPAEGVIFNEDTRSATIGETGFPNDVNQHIKDGAIFESVTGFVVSSFGEPKIIPRSLEDIKGTSWSFPRLAFALNSPSDEASVEISGDPATLLTADWEPTTDYDGDELNYAWNLFLATSDTAPALSVPVNAETEVSLTYGAVSNLLISLGVEPGAIATVYWNVTVSDADSTYPVASRYNFTAQAYEPLFYSVELKRGEMSTSVEDLDHLPSVFKLGQNYPNPFNPTTSISFELPTASDVKLTVYNMLGQRVGTLLNESRAAGRYTVSFDASSLSSGLYVYQLEAGSFKQTRQMMLIK